MSVGLLCDWFGWCGRHAAANAGHSAPEIDGGALWLALVVFIGLWIILNAGRR